MAQLVGHRPAKRRCAGLISGAGTAEVAGSAATQGAHGKQPIDVSLPFSLPFPTL